MAAANRTGHPHFLLATDLAPAATPHLRAAARFADALGARTTLFHSVMPRPSLVRAAMSSGVLLQHDYVAAIRKQLHELVAMFDVSRSVHVAVAESGNARAAILEAADRIDAEMILLPTHGRTGVERAVLGSTAEQVLRRSTRPVLLMTDRMLRMAPTATGDRGPVVVATDLSAGAVVAHRAAAVLADRLGLPMLLVSVVPAREPPPYGGGAPVAPVLSDPQARVQECAKQLRQHAVELVIDRGVEVLARIDDDPAAAIVQTAADQNAELLVLATHGRRGIARMLKGSVAENVVRHATVPVVCMPVAKEGAD